MVWYGVAWCGNTVVCYGLVWFGLVWYGMVWFGLVWYGMLCYQSGVWYGTTLPQDALYSPDREELAHLAHTYASNHKIMAEVG